MVCSSTTPGSRPFAPGGESWQYTHLYWGPASGSTASTPDLFLQEAIAAARRGVKVRILLSDSYLDPRDPKDNTHTVAYLTQLARRENLDLQARIFRHDLAALEKIHNKGLIVDGRKVLVSSINWSQNSPANNREVGLLLEHPDLGAYYTHIFIDVTNGTRFPVYGDRLKVLHPKQFNGRIVVSNTA